MSTLFYKLNCYHSLFIFLEVSTSNLSFWTLSPPKITFGCISTSCTQLTRLRAQKSLRPIKVVNRTGISPTWIDIIVLIYSTSVLVGDYWWYRLSWRCESGVNDRIMVNRIDTHTLQDLLWALIYRWGFPVAGVSFHSISGVLGCFNYEFANFWQHKVWIETKVPKLLTGLFFQSYDTHSFLVRMSM